MVQKILVVRHQGHPLGQLKSPRISVFYAVRCANILMHAEVSRTVHRKSKGIRCVTLLEKSSHISSLHVYSIEDTVELILKIMELVHER